jgi:hypothetical protein
MKVAINQPTYLPWLGYFDLIHSVDLFVVLDNVQFVKQSWQQRNRIKTAAGLQWLTVPVIFRGRLGQLIKDVEIRDAQFSRDHVRAIELAYRRSEYFAEYFLAIKGLLEQRNSGLLVELNLSFIRWAMQALGISTPIVLASDLGVSGKRTELLAHICKAVGATQYVSPLGSAEYLVEEQHLLHGVEISFQRYEHPKYQQMFGAFMPYASLIDLLFNEGPRSAEILRSGRREAYSVAEVSERLAREAVANVVA